MGILDIILLCCFIPAIVQGISKGFVSQVISILSLILGVWAAFKFSKLMSGWLANYVHLDPKVLNIVSFIAVAVLVILLLYFVGRLITKAFDAASITWLNRLLGFVFAIAKTVIILGLLIMVFEALNAKFGLVKPEKLDGAVVFDLLKRCGEFIFPYLKNLVSEAGDLLDNAASTIEGAVSTMTNA